MKKLMYLAAALLVLVGCNNKEEINGTQNPPAEIVTITGGIELPTQDGPNKVAAKDGWEDVTAGQSVGFIWEMGDEIAVTDGEDIKKFRVSKILEGGQTAEFTGEPLSSMEAYAVIYPYEYGVAALNGEDVLWFKNQQYDGKLKVAGVGAGEKENFLIPQFNSIFDLQLKGDVILGSIEYSNYPTGEFEPKAKLSMGEDGLQLTSTPCHVPFLFGVEPQGGFRLRFLDTEGTVLMEKVVVNTPVSVNQIISFPVLEVKPDAPATTPTLADALVEGATFALGVDMREDTKTAFMEFIYQYNGEEFVCTDHKQKGRSIIEPDDPESAADLAMYSTVTLPSENIIRFEYMPGIMEGLYIEFNITSKQYEISELLATMGQCSFGENGYIKVNGVNLLSDLTQKESTQPIVE